MQLIDAVEELMREEGYAALSARNVARQAGLKYQLIFYYFETMDKLLLAAYKRRTERMFRNAEAALLSPQPLHAIWASMFDSTDAALSLEYMAMSNHNAAIRAETVRHGEKMRDLVAIRLAPSLGGLRENSSAVTPIGITWLLNAIMCLLSFESVLGLFGGHREVIAMVQEFLGFIEPQSSTDGNRVRRPKVRVSSNS